MELQLAKKESQDKLIFIFNQATLTLLTLKQKRFLLPPVKDCPYSEPNSYQGKRCVCTEVHSFPH